MTDRSPDSPHPAPDLGETQARQGAWDQDVFWVLAFSTTLAIIVLAAAWIYHAPGMAQVSPTTRSPAVAQSFHTPAAPGAASTLEPANQTGPDDAPALLRKAF